MNCIIASGCIDSLTEFLKFSDQIWKIKICVKYVNKKAIREATICFFYFLFFLEKYNHVIPKGPNKSTPSIYVLFIHNSVNFLVKVKIYFYSIS